MIGLISAAVILFPGLVLAQGSIFGLVANSNLSVPAPGAISFFGYLDDTDEEIRVESSVGAGYDAGNWFDDFQNYLTEAPGNPYDYHFYNTANGEGLVLSKLIPNNSFQQENISLSPVNWPQTPSGLTSKVPSFSRVEIYWSDIGAATFHVYRRRAPSNGSFFRIDDPGGSMANPGVADTFFVDTLVDSSGIYDYLVIAEDASGNLSPHSEIITVEVTVESYILGDSNADGVVDIGDCVYTINFLYRGGAAPIPYEAGNANCEGIVDTGDVVYTINFIFRHGPPPACP